MTDIDIIVTDRIKRYKRVELVDVPLYNLLDWKKETSPMKCNVFKKSVTL